MTKPGPGPDLSRWCTTSPRRSRSGSAEPQIDAIAGPRRSVDPLPLVILAGRDQQGTTLPPDGRTQHRIEGHKAAEIRIAGRPMITLLLERLQASGHFDPIWVAGPADPFARLVSVPLIDTDRHLGENLHAIVQATAHPDPLRPLVVMTSDILPEQADLDTAFADLRAHQPVDFWMPQIRLPVRALGASAWKPTYRLVAHGEQTASAILPGQLLLAVPGITRVDFVIAFFDLLYRTRNRSIARRFAALAGRLTWHLLREDLRSLLRGRPTFHLPKTTLVASRLATRLARGRATADEMERGLQGILIQAAHRARHPQRRAYVPVLDTLSLARDIDTHEEARELSRSLA